jgi:short-subunit dehydrogenase
VINFIYHSYNFHFMHILITGAAQGIGAAIAKQLCSLENTLILVDLQEDKLKVFAYEIRDNCKEVVEFSGNLTDPLFIDTIQKYIESNHIDILINNAGISHKLDSFENLSLDDLDTAYKVNLRAPFELIQSVIPGMKAKGSGTILNVASRANIYGYYHMAIYSATKAALTSLNGTIALENPEIRSITIIPGRTNTPMQANLRGSDVANQAQSPEYVAEVISQVIDGSIDVKSGELVIIDFGKHTVVTELDRRDLHKNMH